MKFIPVTLNFSLLNANYMFFKPHYCADTSVAESIPYLDCNYFFPIYLAPNGT